MKKNLFIFVICLLAGCNQHKLDYSFHRSYVQEYVTISNISLIVEDNVIQVCGVVDGGYSVRSKEYDALCEKHGDMAYNREVSRLMPRVSCCGVDFVSISIISDADFDAEHISGSLLNNITRLTSYSVYPYIKSNYDEHSDGSINKLISELTQDDMVMLGSSFWDKDYGKVIAELSLPAPNIIKTNNITVTMTTDDGRIFSDTVQVTWE